MLRRLFGHMRQNVVAWLALFVALGGTSAYAANEWTGENIVDGSLTGQDIFNNTVSGADITNGSLTGADVFDNTLGSADITNGSLTGADIANESIGAADIGSQQVGPDEVINDSLLQSDIRAGAVTNDEVLNDSLIGADINDNSLTGADINESTLNMPPTTAATFAGQGNVTIVNEYRKVVGRTLSAGSYGIAATANVDSGQVVADVVRDVFCELRNPSGGFIGGGRDRRFIPDGQSATISLSMNGGVQIPAGGGEVGVYCRIQAPPIEAMVADAQMMIIRLDGFF